jgi:hypothetical protein
VLCKVLEGIHLKDVVKRRLTGSDAVKHLSPWSPPPGLAAQNSPSAHRAGRASLQTRTEWCQPKAVLFKLGEDAHTSQGAQQSIERPCVYSRTLRQFFAALCALLQQVGDPELGASVNGL